MRVLSAEELLNVWEQGAGQSRAQQAILLLLAACPEVTPEEIVRLSIGERDSRLMTLREWLFGSQLNSLVHCPQCNEQLELGFVLGNIRATSPDQPEGVATLRLEEYSVDIRLPNSLDLLSLPMHLGKTVQRQALLERCVVLAKHEEQKMAVSQLPARLLGAIIAHITDRDPQADVQLKLDCPSCTHKWRALFDIVSYFWEEIDTWAQRMIQEVHLLASSYGWREGDILSMSSRRRRAYLELMGR